MTPSTFVSFVDNNRGVETVHARSCGKSKQEAREAGSPLYPASDNLRAVVIETWQDVWSDKYPTTEAAIEAGELATYAAHYTRVCPCAVKAGFKNTL